MDDRRQVLAKQMKQLCEQLIAATEEQEITALSFQLRTAVRDYLDKVRTLAE